MHLEISENLITHCIGLIWIVEMSQCIHDHIICMQQLPLLATVVVTMSYIAEHPSVYVH